jgi:hypothetical protein
MQVDPDVSVLPLEAELDTPGWQFAVAGGILGWVLDAFDFFVVIFLFNELMAKFDVGKPAIVWSLKLLDLSFAAHGENNPLLCLEVKNNGETAKITATIRVVSRSYGEPVNTRPYTGQWTHLPYKPRCNGRIAPRWCLCGAGPLAKRLTYKQLTGKTEGPF